MIEEKNIPWFDYRRITYPLAESDFSDKMETGEYRTLKSSIPENWGKKTEITLNNYLAANYEEPDYLKYNIIKNLLGKISPFWKNIYQGYNVFRDLGRNLGMAYETGLTGADKFFHCAANYEAAKRGMSEGETAINLSRNREIFQALGPDADLQDASDDMAANLRGKRGAETGKTLWDSCPRNPREYYK